MKKVKQPTSKFYICIFYILKYLYVKYYILTSLVAQTVKHLPTMQETWVRSLGQEDLLEKEMATHSNPMDRGAWGVTKSRTQLSDFTFTFILFININIFLNIIKYCIFYIFIWLPDAKSHLIGKDLMLG